MDQGVNYLPLFFNLTGKPCLVVGGGRVALRKVKQLLDAGAIVTIIAPRIGDDIQKMTEPGRCVWHKRKYASPEACAYHLVIATTSDPATNRQISKDCADRHIPVNVADQPNLCSVIFPSTARRRFITAAISSGGAAPFFTRFLRERLQDFLANIYQLETPELLVQFRDFVRMHTDDFDLKNRLYQRLLACSREQWSQWSPDNPPYELWQEWLEAENA